MYVYEFDWSPDSKEIVYLAAPGPGDDNWYIAEVYRVDAQSGGVSHLLKPSMQVANVRWSPDGKTIAFIGGMVRGVRGIVGAIYGIPACGSAAGALSVGR